MLQCRRAAKKIDAIVLERSSATRLRPSVAILHELIELRGELVTAEHCYGPTRQRADIRVFREALERRWSLDGAVQGLQVRISQLENAIRTSSSMDTERLVYIISTIGLPFAISQSLTPIMQKWFADSLAWMNPTVVAVVLFFGISLILILLGTGAIEWWLRRARHARITR